MELTYIRVGDYYIPKEPLIKLPVGEGNVVE